MMLRRFIDHHRRLVIWLASSLLVGMVLVNSLWFFGQLSQPNPAAPSNPVLTLPNGELLGSGDLMSKEPDTSWLPMAISVGGMVLFAAALASFNIIMIKRAQGRDERRRQDLAAISEAFEAYYDGYGHYPVSSSYENDYYRAILLTNEWQHYDMPAAEVMKTYLPTWPVSDPSISIKDADQRGNYLYYPFNNGQYFRLYAVLERYQGQQTAAEKDGLPEELYQYNFRIESRRGDVPAQAQPVIEAIGGSENIPDIHTDQTTDGLAVISEDVSQESRWLEAADKETRLDISPSQTVISPLPVIQPSTLPLDVRMAQGSVIEATNSLNQEVASTPPTAANLPSPVTGSNQHIRSLDQPVSEAQRQLNDQSDLSLQPTASQSQIQPATAETSDPISGMPRLFFDSDEDTR